MDANSAGNVHGGTIMKLVDEAAGLAGVRHSRRRVVTAAVDRLTFLVPVHVGDLVTFSATVNAVWRSSMEVGVRVESEAPGSGEVRHASSAYLTMVAVDEEGRPARVPPLRCESDDERRREREAQARRRHRLAEREEIMRSREAEAAEAATRAADG